MTDLEGSHRRLSGPLIVLGALTIVAVGLLLLGTWWGDPVIYLPYARNIARGDFFSYDPGRFSSGSTSPLWALLLAIPYLLGAGHVGAKIFSLLFTLGAWLLTVRAARRVVGPTTASAVASFYLLEMLTLFGVMMYESALIVALVALAILAGDRVVREWGETGRLRFGSLLPLILIWSATPIARPDATVLVGLQIAALWLACPCPSRDRRALAMLIGAGMLAAVPSLLYFGYSQMALGAVSVSSKARAFALKEMAQRIGPIYFSKVALGYLGSILYALLLAAFGLDLFRGEPRTRWLTLYGLGALLLYPIMLVFVSPVTNDLPRYFLPIAPIVVVCVARILKKWEETISPAWTIGALAVGLLFVAKPVLGPLAEALDQRKRGYTFEQIVEREGVEKINRMARPGDTVLAYEVQDRYHLRDDVGLLSLDGITDGLVVPYLPSADMKGFLLRYRPRFWIANDADAYRPYLRRSMLRGVMDAFRNDGTLREHRVDGIGFRLIERRTEPMPRGFAGWTMLFEIDYAG